MKKFFSSTMCVGLLCLLASPGWATFVQYEDRTAFLNAATGAGLSATNEDFSSDPGNPFTLNDGNGNSLSFGYDPAMGASYNATLELLEKLPGFVQVLLDSNGFTGQVYGLGFDFSVDMNDGVEIDTFGAGLFTHSGLSNVPITGFLGVLSTDGMDFGAILSHLVVDTDGSIAQLDNLVMITPAPIPIPSSLLLFGTGLIGLIGWNHRRAKKS